jgi:quercetin dioxygenase-like cupin family protein
MPHLLNEEKQMTSFSHLVKALAIAVITTIAASATVMAQSLDKPFTVVEPAQIQWKDAGKGVKFAVISGDPSKPGPYVIRVIFPPGVMSAPHYHREDRYVTVMQGTWLAGVDDSWDPKTTQPLSAGSYMLHPAGAIHYDGGGTESATVQIMGIGPSSTTFLFPQVGDFGAPRKLN